jgi:hypothetical protein
MAPARLNPLTLTVTDSIGASPACRRMIRCSGAMVAVHSNPRARTEATAPAVERADHGIVPSTTTRQPNTIRRVAAGARSA